MTLEQQLVDLIRKHGLLNISITAITSDGVGGEVKFYATTQAPDGDINGCWCGSSSFSSDVQSAVKDALYDLHRQRGVCDVPFAPMGEAA